MKVAVIGGGSTYTPELVNGFLERMDRFPLSELWLMDIDPERLEIVGGFAQRMVAAKGRPSRWSDHATSKRAVAGAAYVITQLRVGKMPARRADEYLGRRHGLIGQETTGVGGMAKALRTIPVILRSPTICASLRPGRCWSTSPTPPGWSPRRCSVCADVPSVGVCNVPITTKMGILQGWKKAWARRSIPSATELNTLGLNHLSWHRGFTPGWRRYLAAGAWQASWRSCAAIPTGMGSRARSKALRMMPNYYLQYFYHTDQKLADAGTWPPSRAEAVMEIEEDLLQQYADPALIEPPADLMKRGGAYYSTVATQLLTPITTTWARRHVVNTAP